MEKKDYTENTSNLKNNEEERILGRSSCPLKSRKRRKYCGGGGTEGLGVVRSEARMLDEEDVWRFLEVDFSFQFSFTSCVSCKARRPNIV